MQMIARVPFDYAKVLTQKSVWMPRSKTGVSKEDPRIVLEDGCIEDIIREKRIKK